MNALLMRLGSLTWCVAVVSAVTIAVGSAAQMVPFTTASTPAGSAPTPPERAPPPIVGPPGLQRENRGAIKKVFRGEVLPPDNGGGVVGGPRGETPPPPGGKICAPAAQAPPREPPAAAPAFTGGGGVDWDRRYGEAGVE